MKHDPVRQDTGRQGAGRRGIGLQGIICPMVTPFDDQGRIVESSFCAVIDFLLEHDIDGIMVGGTTGEGMSLTTAERMRLCELAVEQVGGRVPVIAHTGCVTTAETVELARHAQSAGATASSVIVPYFYTFDDESLFQHFVTVAEATPDLPTLLYTFPGNAKNDISPALLKRLLDATDNIVGFKSSSSDLVRFHDYVQAGGPEFIAICGSDALMLPALALGSHGQISGNANVFPETPNSLLDAFRAGDLAEAQRQQQTIDRIRRTLGDGLHPAYFKAGLRLRGVPAGHVRPPMRELSPQEQARLEHEMEQLVPLVRTA